MFRLKPLKFECAIKAKLCDLTSRTNMVRELLARSKKDPSSSYLQHILTHVWSHLASLMLLCVL